MGITKEMLELLNTATAYNGKQHRTLCGKSALELLDYKQIEEKLGIDLITLYNAFINGFWFKEECLFVTGEDLKAYKQEICSLCDEEHGLIFSPGISSYYKENTFYPPANLNVAVIDGEICFFLGVNLGAALLKDHGKTWALTKEELL